MIELRGGIARLMKENRPLALKPLRYAPASQCTCEHSISDTKQKLINSRLDIELAMQNGSPTMFDSSQVPVTTVLCNSSALEKQLSACTPGLPRIMLDLVVFAGILNDRAKGGRSKLNPLDYTETLTSLLYRLLEGDPFRQQPPIASEGLYGDATRLAMLAFMAGLLPNYCCDNFGSSLLGIRLAEAVQKVHAKHAGAEGAGDVSLPLWILFMSGVSILRVNNHGWLLSTIADTCDRADLRDWVAVHDLLSEFPWINTLHDAPALCLWEEAQRVRLDDH